MSEETLMQKMRNLLDKFSEHKKSFEKLCQEGIASSQDKEEYERIQAALTL